MNNNFLKKTKNNEKSIDINEIKVSKLESSQNKLKICQIKPEKSANLNKKLAAEISLRSQSNSATFQIYKLIKRQRENKYFSYF